MSFLRLERKGRGRALRAAWSASDAQVVCYMDVDLSTDLRGLLPLVAPLLSGHSDVAIGTRLAHGARVVRGPRRELISRAYNRLLRVTLRARFSDAQCGFKAVRSDLLEDLLPAVRDEGWFFDTELLVAAQRRGLRIHEVPVDWIDDPDSRVRIVRTAIDDLRGVARLMAASPVARFAAVGIVCTVAYALLFLLLRGVLGATGANAVALAATALGNTALNRRFTFRVRGRAGLLRHHARGALVFVLTLALTNGALLVLHGLDATPPGAIELVVLVAANLAATVTRYVAMRTWVFAHAAPLFIPTHDNRQENRMNPRSRKVAVFLGAAALAGAAGIGVAAGGDSAATGNQPEMSRPGPGGAGGGPGGFDLAALAEKLGVTESRLREAMASARPAAGRPDASTMAEALAAELGLSTDEVEAALEKTMPPGGGQGGYPPPATLRARRPRATRRI